jgi:hypothetical protein
VIARKIGDRSGEGSALWNTALALDALAERAQAIASAEDALVIFEGLDSPESESVRTKIAEWNRGGSKDRA